MKLSPREHAATVKKIDKINKRATKRGFNGRITIHAERVVSRNQGRPLPYPCLPENAEVVEYETTITGDAPCYEGWTFLASLDSLPGSDGTTEWVVRCAPGVAEVAVDRTALRPGACDHCNTHRANRRKLYLVQHRDTGELRQVGATCIKDFLGWSAAPVFIATRDLLDDEPEPLGHDETAFTPRYVVLVALATVSAYGWTSRATAQAREKPATADIMWPYLYGSRDEHDRAVINAIEKHITEADAVVDDVIDTVLAEFATHDHGYGANLCAALRAEYVEAGQIGITASAVAAHQRIVAQRAEQKLRTSREAFEPEHLGSVGDKVEFSGVVTTAMSIDGYTYNTTQNLIIITTQTAVVKFYSSAAWTYEVERGDVVKVAATIKKLATWRGKKQTVVSRPKLIETIESHDSTPA